MILCIKNQRGKEVKLNPVLSTKQDLIEQHGETFTLPGSDFLYHVHEVYAKPSPDTSVMMALLMAFFSFLFARDWNVSFVSMLIAYFISKIYFYFDQKAVNKFNNSKTF